MRVLIDADGCPVVDIAAELCEKHHIPCLLLCDTAHELCRAGATTLVFDQGADSVDFALANRVQAGDLVVTQDYGLAGMCLARGARVLHQDGWEYTAMNIDALLFQRHASKKARMAGVRMKHCSKRTPQQNKSFQAAMEAILTAQKASQG